MVTEQTQNIIEAFNIKIDGRWVHLSEDAIKNHPGGGVITQYKNSDATHVFHAFHEGSARAYKQIEFLKKHKAIEVTNDPTLCQKRKDVSETNVAEYNLTVEQEVKMVNNFEKLRQRMHEYGLMDEDNAFYCRKSFDTLALIVISFSLQYYGWYIVSSVMLALAFQQLGWLAHEYCHHQPSKNRRYNQFFGLFFANFCQGFSSDWWKNKHNTHHAATNIVDHDTDIDLTPLLVLVPSQLKQFQQPIEKLLLKVVPYQHLYYTMMLPLIRASWTSQSIEYVFTETSSSYKQMRMNAFWEQVTIIAHWIWILLQLYCLPDLSTRITYFIISQFLGGFLIGFVVTFNHNSVDKYPADSRLFNNFAAMHILTTRNMNPSPFTDWLWGGLNYQIEHHLFPTMPRSNLNKASKLVKRFCKENNLPYLCDDYITGYKENLRQLENMAKQVLKNQMFSNDDTNNVS